MNRCRSSGPRLAGDPGALEILPEPESPGSPSSPPPTVWAACPGKTPRGAQPARPSLAPPGHRQISVGRTGRTATRAARGIIDDSQSRDGGSATRGGLQVGCEGPETGKEPLSFLASPQLRLAQAEIRRHPGQSQALLLHRSSEPSSAAACPGGFPGHPRLVTARKPRASLPAQVGRRMGLRGLRRRVRVE